MITREDILQIIEGKLNELASRYSDEEFNIVFDGSLGFYHHEWVKEKFDTNITPYVLTTNLWDIDKSIPDGINFRFTLGVIPFSKDRNLMEVIFADLQKELKFEVAENGNNVFFRPTSFNTFRDFSEGSGRGIQRFELLFEFEGNSNSVLGGEAIEFLLDNEEIPIQSFKYEQAKTNFYGKDEIDTGINDDVLIIESILGKDSFVLEELLSKHNKSSIKKNISLKINEIEVISGIYSFENYTISYSKDLEAFVVYLYFMKYVKGLTIEIETDQIKVISYSVATASDLEGHLSLDTNISSSLWTGSARAFSFVVEEDYNNGVVQTLVRGMFDEIELEPTYNIKIIYGQNDEIFEKVMLLKEISGEGSGTLQLVFVDLGDVRG